MLEGRALRPGPTRGRVLANRPRDYQTMSSELSEPAPGLVGLWLLLVPLSLPLCLPWFSRALLEAKSLTHSPMPCTPRRAAEALQAPTCVLTCWPQLVGFKLPVTATSVAAPATTTAAAATAIPVSGVAPSAAPAPPKSLFMIPPDNGALRSGIGAAAIGSRIRCSSRSSSLSKSPVPFIGKKEPSLRLNYPFFFAPARDPASNRDLAIGIPVIVTEHDGCCLLRRQLSQGGHEVGALHHHGGISRRGGSADATQNGTDLLEPLPALAVDSRVDGDAVEPGFGGGIGPPRLPGLERAFESVLGAVLRGLAVAQHRDQSPQNPPVRVAIKALEVGL